MDIIFLHDYQYIRGSVSLYGTVLAFYCTKKIINNACTVVVTVQN